MQEKEKPQITVFGQTNFRNVNRRFGIKVDDRRRHTYVIGKTGMGKTTCLKSMIYADIINGNGLAVVDPHGDLAEEILKIIPPHRINDVVYFNPSDIDYPIAFNVLEKVDPRYQHLVASGLVGVFKKIWADSWGPRLEYLLRNAILALLDHPDSTLLGIPRLFVDKAWRKKVIDRIQDPVVKAFWVEEYQKYPDKFQKEAIAPIQNKVGQFLSSSLIRNVVGQVRSTIDMRTIMDNQKILIMNLSKGRIGEDNSAMLGAMMITKIQLAAMGRVDTPEEERKDFYLYVDEFQNFATESFANILSEARKYRLCLIVAHQYIEQLDERVAAAVFGNVGTILTFRVGATDAEYLEKEFSPRFVIDDLVNLPKHNFYIKLMIDGITSDPFSAETLSPDFPEYNNEEKIIRVSRERYAKSKEVVEDKIRRWSLALDEKKTFDQKDEQPERREERKMYEIECWACGKKEELPFEPDYSRPIYCQEHLDKIRKNALSAQEKAHVKKRRKEIMISMKKQERQEHSQHSSPVKKEEKNNKSFVDKKGPQTISVSEKRSTEHAKKKEKPKQEPTHKQQVKEVSSEKSSEEIKDLFSTLKKTTPKTPHIVKGKQTNE